MARLGKGCRGTWEIPCPPLRDGTEKRADEVSDPGETGSRSAAVVATKRGNQLKGPCGAKSGT